MKIKNIGHKNLKVAFNPKKGQTLIIELKPGQIIFGEPNSVDNKQILILTRKGILHITEDDKPLNGEYYKAYGVLPHADIIKLKNPKPSNSSFVLEESDEDEQDEQDEDSPIINTVVNETVLPKEDLEEFIIPEEEEEEEPKTQIENDDDADIDNEDNEQKTLSSVEESDIQPPKNKGGRPKGSLNKPKKKKKKSAKKSK